MKDNNQKYQGKNMNKRLLLKTFKKKLHLYKNKEIISTILLKKRKILVDLHNNSKNSLKFKSQNRRMSRRYLNLR